MNKSPEGFSPFENIVVTAWGYDKDFSINTQNPSEIVRDAVKMRLIGARNRVLDLGCGKNPRNALYLATHFSCQVDGIDLEVPQIPPKTPDFVENKMRFTESSVMDSEFGQEVYDAALLTRLIQYLSSQELSVLLHRVSASLKPQGVIALSYTAAGGILNRKAAYEIETFSHPLEDVQSTLQTAGFTIVTINQGKLQSTHVPHSGEPALTYNILAQKTPLNLQ